MSDQRPLHPGGLDDLTAACRDAFGATVSMGLADARGDADVGRSLARSFEVRDIVEVSQPYRGRPRSRALDANQVARAR